MHMRIDATREREPILGVKDLAGEIGLNFRPEPSDLSILDRNIKTIDRGLVRSNHSGVLDDGIELFIHARRSFAYWRSSYCACWCRITCRHLSCYSAWPPIHIVCRARSMPVCRLRH